MLIVREGRGGKLNKSWTVRFVFDGKQREIGIGKYPILGLADARQVTRDVHTKVNAGIDPIEERKQNAEERRAAAEAEETAAAEAANVKTFRECAETYIAHYEASWANPKHRQQWKNTLETYAYPVVGDLNVKDVGVDEIMEIIQPIWSTKTETASRLRGRIEKVLGWAVVKGFRPGPNPAVWRGNLDHLLPKQSRVHQVVHHPALEWDKVPDFIKELRVRPGPSSRALEYTILTAARSGEVRFARWSEIDWEKGIWTVPASRMKMKREHRVPLSSQALKVLRNRKSEVEVGEGDLIFFNSDPSRSFSDAVYRALFKRMKRDGITTHGFRSSFRDWAGEKTNHSRETAELALAHQVGDDTERAYRRGDALEKRRALMQDWADFIDSSM